MQHVLDGVECCGSYVSPLSCVSCVPTSFVHIWFVSCPCLVWLLVKSVPAMFVSLACVFKLLPGQFCVVWSTPYSPVFLSVSALYYLSLLLVCGFLYHPRVCTMSPALFLLYSMFYFYLLYNKKLTWYVYCVRLTETWHSTCISLLFCWFSLLLLSSFVSHFG